MKEQCLRMKLWQIIFAVFIGISAISAAGYYGYQTSRPEETPVVEPPTVSPEVGDVILSVTAPGRLIDDGEVTLLAKVSGQVEEVAVRPGDLVKTGQVLARLGERRRFEAALADARIRLIEAQIALETHKSGLPLAEARLALTEAQKAYDKAATQRESKQYARSSQETIDIARANLVIAEDHVSRIEKLYDTVDDREESDPVRAEAFSQLAAAKQKYHTALANLNYLLGKPNQQEIDEADAQLELTRAQLEKAQREVDSLLGDGSPALALAEASLAKAEMELQDAQFALDSLVIEAPFDGVVTEVNILAGQGIADGAPLLVITDPKQLLAEVTIVEEDFPLVEAGQIAQLFFDAIPDAEVSGKVSQIVPKRSQDDRALYTVYIALDHQPEKLASGMTVDASIVIHGKEEVLRLPRAVVRARSDGSALIEVWENGQAQQREIWVGLRGDSYVEIISGLEEGQRVVAR
jgi:HlyD family secretion protein